MKSLSVLVGFLGGAVVGAACGLLFAPRKGEDTRKRVCEVLRKNGINLDRHEMNDLVDKIANEMKSEVL